MDFIADQGKLLYMASGGGLMAWSNTSNSIQERFRQCSSKEDFLKLRQDFFDAVKAGTCKDLGFREHAYGMTKLFLIVWGKWFSGTQVIKSKGIQVATICPGFIDTDMVRPMDSKATKTIYQGAETPLFLIQNDRLKTNPSEQGGMFSDCNCRETGIWKN